MLQAAYQVAEVVELNEIFSDDREPMTFRIEVLRNLTTKKYHARLYRLETFNLKLFHKIPGMTHATYSIWVEDVEIDLEEKLGNTIKQARETVIARLNDQIFPNWRKKKAVGKAILK